MSEKRLWLVGDGQDEKNPFEIYNTNEEKAEPLFICPTHAEAVTWCKNLGDHDMSWKEFFVFDNHYDVMVKIDSGEVKSLYNPLYEDDFKEEKRVWGVKLEKPEDDYEVSCSSCGDGGCVHCEPSRFIDGYIGY